MTPTITNNKTPSLQQPIMKTRERWVKMIEKLLAVDCEDQARELDRQHRIGYFSSKEKEEHQPHEHWLDKFITVDEDMRKLKDKIRKLIDVEDAVLILGESGTGKELLAHALHGKKPKEKFIAFNCAGSTEHLIESELFGHEKGAFTGADKQTDGLFHLAQDGTLFLDEVGELPLQTQAKLLRILQDHQVRRVGGKEWITLKNTRIVAATHQPLDAMVSNGQFRLDLFFRLSCIELQTKPLRERLEDIKPIIASLEQIEGEFPKDFPWSKYVATHKLAGNVRSLEHIVRRYQLFRELPLI